MTTSNTSGVSQQRVNQYKASELYPSSQEQALGSGQVDPELQQANIDWIRQNQTDINAVLNGTSSLSQADQELLMEYYDYAKQVASGEIPSDSSGAGDVGANVPQSGPVVDPFGGHVDQNGNIVYDSPTDGEDIRVAFTEEGNYKVFPGTGDVIIDAPGNGMTVDSAVVTQDPNGKDVLKVVLKNEATGEEAVYLIYNFKDTHVKINLASGQEVNMAEIAPELASVNSNDGELLLQVGEYQTAAAAPETDESGIMHTVEDGKDVFEAPPGQIVELSPTGNGKAGQVDETEVFGPASISVMPSDEVTILPSSFDEDQKADEYIIVVTHRDGSQDRIVVHGELNINGKESQITLSALFGSVPLDSSQGEEFFNNMLKGSLFINNPSSLTSTEEVGEGEEGEASGAVAGQVVGANDITAPNDVSEDSATAIYSQPDDVTLTATYGTGVKTYDITLLPGKTANIHTTNLRDEVDITNNGDGTYTYEVYKVASDGNRTNNPEDKVTFIVRGGETSLNANPDNVNYRSSPTAGFVDYTAGIDKNISVSGEKSYDEGITSLAEFLDMTPEEFMDKAEEAGLTEDDFTEAPPPSRKVLNFLMEIDPTLKEATEKLNGRSTAGEDSITDKKTLRSRLVQLLTHLYPEEEIDVVSVTGDRNQRMSKSDQIKIGDDVYDIYNDLEDRLEIREDSDAN